MLYKQAWEELKDYIENRLRLLVGQGVIRQTLLSEMKQLEKRWKIIPEKAEMKCPNCGKKMIYEDETEDGEVIKRPYYWCYFCQIGQPGREGQKGG